MTYIKGRKDRGKQGIKQKTLLKELQQKKEKASTVPLSISSSYHLGIHQKLFTIYLHGSSSASSVPMAHSVLALKDPETHTSIYPSYRLKIAVLFHSRLKIITPKPIILVLLKHNINFKIRLPHVCRILWFISYQKRDLIYTQQLLIVYGLRVTVQTYISPRVACRTTGGEKHHSRTDLGN